MRCRGFRLVWNLLVGIPLLVPSFMYEGVHNQHHAKRYYGTVNDPEYLPLALMKPWTLPVFLVAAALAPVGDAVPLRRSGAAVAAVADAARDGGRPLFGAADQSAVPPPQPEGEFRRDWLAHGKRVQHLGDRTAGDGRRPASFRSQRS